MPLTCGQCLKQFKSYLRMQAHMSEIHGQKNAATKWTNYNQKEGLAAAEENLKKEISKWQYYNN